jgi:RHS repeat-associated protein
MEVTHGSNFIHADHLNTPRLITNQVQQAVWRWDQAEPFGTYPANENPSGLGVFEFNLRFPGQYFDKETGLHHNFYRDYEPSLGRYHQSDPVGIAAGVNTYAYVSGDPLRFGDFFGLARTCGSGKSEPYTPNFFFSKCCGEHDDCYDDCINRSSKDRCDNDFTRCAFQQCSNRWFAVRFACETTAVFYSEIVRRAGDDAFDDARKKCAGGVCKK